jgi:LAGLIDADG DNA endonuclease family protein
MAGENPSGAGNQQERPNATAWLNGIPDNVGHYIAGFVEGEGSFNVPIRRSRYRSIPWRVAVSFNVSQIGPELPEFLRSIFEVGTVRGRGDGVFYFEVTQPVELEVRVFPFFERFPLRGPKRGDLGALCQITRLIQSGAHRSSEGIDRILEIRSGMNRGGKRRYSDEEIRRALARWESSEAIRQPALLDGRGEDMVLAPWRHGET